MIEPLFTWCYMCFKNKCSPVTKLVFLPKQQMLIRTSHFPLVFTEATASLMPPVKTGSCLSMDGWRHENKESWHDGCRECYCHNGREMCALITCPVPSCANPTIHPGQCCPSCPGKTWFLLRAL